MRTKDRKGDKLTITDERKPLECNVTKYRICITLK